MLRRACGCKLAIVFWSLSISSLLVRQAEAQRLTTGDDVSVPMPGSGHDYINLLNETVNPANGTLQLQFQLPVPKGRGVTIPASLSYNSNAMSIAPTLGQTNWNSTAGPVGAQLLVSAGNWGFSVPFVTATAGQTPQYANTQTYYCNYATYYQFMDATGMQHPLNVDYADQTVPDYGFPCQYSETFGMQNGGSVLSGGDGHVLATLTSNAVNSALVVSDLNGTLYHFPAPTFYLGTLPDYIEDRNGNKITASSPGQQHGVFTFTDDAGRTSVASSGIGPAGSTTTFSTPAFSYKVAWGSGATGGSDFSVNPTLVSTPNNQYFCYPPSETYGGQGIQVSSLTLPNLREYTFTYDSATGELNQITYPDGGSVSYTWAVAAQSGNGEQASYDGQGRNADSQLIYTASGGCVYRYSLPQIAARTVKYGNGTGITQNYTYSTTWGSSGWTSKTTTVMTTDTQSGQSFKTVYTYSPQPETTNSDLFLRQSSTQVPVESQIQYYDWGSTKILRTVHKAWLSGDLLTCEVDTLDDGVTSSGSWSSYLSDIVTDLKEYDYGAISSSACSNASAPSGFIRETKTPVNVVRTAVGGSIFELASKSVFNAGGSEVAETDYSYDLPFQATTTVSGLLATTHDETNYAAAGTAKRGNLTSRSEKCFLGGISCSSNPLTTYAYDETGQMVASEDPCGNANCSDMASSNHVTMYSYTDYPAGGNAYGNSNAYLTTVTDPLGHMRKFSYDYPSGKLTASTDEFTSGSGNTTKYYYNNTQASPCSTSDGLDRLTEIDYPDLGVTQHCYDDSVPSMTTRQLLSGSTWKTTVSTMDGLGQVVGTALTSDLTGVDYTATHYDGLGRAYQVWNPSHCNPLLVTSCPGESTWGMTTYGYDGLGRKKSQANPDGSTEVWGYNDSVVSFTDANANVWQRTSDALGRLIKVLEPSGGSKAATLETDYSYDLLNNLTAVSQCGAACPASNAVKRQSSYDSLSRLIQSYNPEAGWACYGTSGGAIPNGTNCTSGYDGNGNLMSKTDGRGVVVNYKYDGLNRLVSKAFTSDGNKTPSSCYQYDSASVTNGIGRLSSEWTQSASAGACAASPPSTGLWSRRSVLTYDVMGRIRSEQQCTPSTCSSGTPYALAYSYDLAGNVIGSNNGITSTPVVNTLSLTYTIDAAGRQQALSSNWVDSTHPSSLYSAQTASSPACLSSQTYPFAAFGGLLNASFGGGGLVLNRTYDNRLRSACETDTGSLLKNATYGSAAVTMTGQEQSK